jgi:WD40 repeat protein
MDDTQMDQRRGPLDPVELGILKHEGPVASVAFRSDARYLATGSLDGTVRMYNEGLEEVLRLQHERVLEVVFSPNGELLATAGQDKTARLWEIKTGKEIVRLPHQGMKALLASRTIAFSSDSKHFLSSGDEMGALLYDLVSDKTVARLRHKKVVEEVAFSSRTQRAATAAWDGFVRVWDLGGRELFRLPHKWTTYLAPFSVEFSPMEDLIATASAGFPGTARIWSLATGQEVRRTGSHGGLTFINAVAYSDDGRYLVTLAGDVSGPYTNVACIWNASTGSQVGALSHEAFIISVAFSPDGEHMASGSKDGAVGVWKCDTGIPLTRIDLGAAVNKVTWRPDGRAIVCASDNQTASIWQIWAPAP